ncbi:CD209 antigen-like protein D isoform X2 [Pangasianodon hypophthalmus]|uniref:CD209 antigen-like protein D isoform X2 n=1 Tax=Pangasianodon hypophthalmus TaxID=310915 RepID=UPI00230759D1|nr:CD209 antigen-like protein D isoform X2 [Pangasianodon hypophthalmus]
MDAEKLSEVEMKELTPAEVQDDKDAEKDKMEGTKEAEKKAEEAEAKNKKEEANVYCKLKTPSENFYSVSMHTSSPKCSEGQEKEKAQEDEEANLYCKLKASSENVYMSTMTSSTPKHNKDVYRRVCLYKRISAVFTILSVLLLAVVLALAMKLYEVQSIQKCPELSAEVENKHNYPSNQGYQCSECGKGWVRFNNSCFFISKERLSWQESREACQKQGGDLVVIRNEYVQKTLTKYWGMLYWIGLRYSEKQQWMWVNNTALTKSYWAQGQPESASEGSCALLRGRGSPTNNWHSNPCVVSSNYICQRG